MKSINQALILFFLATCIVACNGKGADQAETATDAAEPEQGTSLNVLTPAESTDGFRVLFDGKSLAGWHGYGGNDAAGRWFVEDGALAIGHEGEGRTDLVTDTEFNNFELRLEWKISPGGNSGIMFNVTETPEYSTPWRTGPELQILDNDGHADSSPTHRAGDLYDLVSGNAEMSRPVGEWNETRLRVNNGRIRHWLNGTMIIDVQMWDAAWDELVANSKFSTMPGFGRYRSGRISLQDHGDPVAFRNIRIREF